MARQIVEQPNGLYAMWSTVIDDFIEINLTKEEYIEYRAKEAYEDKKKDLEEIFTKKINFKPMKECLRSIKEIHGKKTFDKRSAELNSK